MKFRALVSIALAAAAATAGACRDATSIGAAVRTATDTLVASALSGTPASSLSALSLVGFTTDSLADIYADANVMRVDSMFEFDLAFDIDANGQAVLLTPRQVGNLLAIRFIPTSGGPVAVGPQRVGLRVLDAGTLFEQVVEAPSGGFVNDSLVRVSPGQVVAIRSFNTICQSSLNQFIFAKLVVDSAVAAQRKVYFRVTLNRNCGYRSFRPGLPTS